MANNQYVVAENWGTGFIEHNESREISFTGHPGNVWQVPTKNGTANKWISKVLGVLKTKDEAQAILKETVKLIDKVASKGIIHKNKAANKKSTLYKYINSL